jgi:hypothetical protein
MTSPEQIHITAVVEVHLEMREMAPLVEQVDLVVGETVQMQAQDQLRRMVQLTLAVVVVEQLALIQLDL